MYDVSTKNSEDFLKLNKDHECNMIKTSQHLFCKLTFYTLNFTSKLN